jgi:ABC-2 type transport system permease protein
VRATLVIAKREFLERVRTKWFLVMTILWPVFMVGTIVIPALLASRGSEARIEVVDKSGKLGQPLVEMLALPPLAWHVTLAPANTATEDLRARIRDKQINGFLVVPEDVLASGEPTYYGDNASNQVVQVVLQQRVPMVVQRVRAKQLGLSDEQIASVLAPVRVVAQHDTGKGETMSGIETLVLGYIIAFLLYMAIALYGVNVMRSVVTEKSSRVVELLVAAAKPRALMAGKIAGVGGAGLAQLMIWLIVGAVALANRDTLLGWFGASGGGGSALPSLSVEQVAVVLGFFILGYVFYASLYAAMGATVSSDADTQQAQIPITLLLVVAIIALQAVTSEPRGGTAQVMTMVPFWSPMLMPLRYFLGGATTEELALSLAILVVSTLVVIRVAAKIYRVGILMYGKRPGLGELIRWLRY